MSISIPAAAKQNNVLDIKESISDNNIVYPESFEADTRKMLEGWYMKNYMATDDRYKTLGDTKTDEHTIRERLAKLPTVIELPYNQVVRSYIDRYTQHGRDKVTALLGLSHYYMPIFEQALEERGLPLELKYLPVIESALDPNAVSKHGAAGLWQFMLITAKGMGLEVNSIIDERRDPYLSSQKAAQLLSDLYATYHDWSLAIAAYNCGPGNVNKAIRRAGGDPKKHDFWSIYNYLSPETRGYFPLFIAANYVMNYYPEHNISPVIPTKPLITDTIHVSSPVHFEQISAVLDIPIEELRVLNPQFRADRIPGSVDHPYILILPSQQIHAYIMSEDAIHNYEADKYAHRINVQPGELLDEAHETPSTDTSVASAEPVQEETPNDPQPIQTPTQSKSVQSITHKVQPGESLASIAALYDVTPEQIKTLNSLRRNSLRTGQILRVTTAKTQEDTKQAVNMNASRGEQNWQAETPKTPAAPKKATTKETKKQKAAPAPTSHTLKSGDTLSSLAQKYGVSVADLKKANNLSNDKIRAGDTIKIPSKGKSNSKSNNTKSNSKTSSKKKRR